MRSLAGETITQITMITKSGDEDPSTTKRKIHESESSSSSEEEESANHKKYRKSQPEEVEKVLEFLQSSRKEREKVQLEHRDDDDSEWKTRWLQGKDLDEFIERIQMLTNPQRILLANSSFYQIIEKETDWQNKFERHYLFGKKKKDPWAELDLVLIPINPNSIHWALALIHPQRNLIQIVDSLLDHQSLSILRDYHYNEYSVVFSALERMMKAYDRKYREGEEKREMYREIVPFFIKQQDGFNCGIYLLSIMAAIGCNQLYASFIRTKEASPCLIHIEMIHKLREKIGEINKIPFSSIKKRRRPSSSQDEELLVELVKEMTTFVSINFFLDEK